ncbi:MAG: aminopeptidase [Solirubrobacteraceae bacterium]
MSGPHPARFADLLTGYCLEVTEGKQVLVRSTTLAAPLLLELQRAILARGGWPLLRIELPGETEAFFAHAREGHLDGFPAVALAEAEGVDASLRVVAPENTRSLAGVDPARMARAARARQPIREAALSRRWSLTLWPTAASAQEAGMSLADFEAFVNRALYLDRADPAQAWQELRATQERLIERLRDARELRIEAEGTDLRLRVEGRTWVNSDGRRNMPSGEVFTSPLEGSANGTIRYTVPSSPAGVEVSGIALTFRAGEVVHAQAERGGEYLERTLATDRGARRLGEIGIGTNTGIDRPVGNILFDEKMGGTVHLAVGRSYPEAGGVNESAVHWDMICDLREGGRLTADGETIVDCGRLAD